MYSSNSPLAKNVPRPARNSPIQPSASSAGRSSAPRPFVAFHAHTTAAATRTWRNVPALLACFYSSANATSRSCMWLKDPKMLDHDVQRRERGLSGLPSGSLTLSHGSFFPAPYMTRHGETDSGLRSKQLLELSRRRYEKGLRDVWLLGGGGVWSAVARRLKGRSMREDGRRCEMGRDVEKGCGMRVGESDDRTQMVE